MIKRATADLLFTMMSTTFQSSMTITLVDEMYCCTSLAKTPLKPLLTTITAKVPTSCYKHLKLAPCAKRSDASTSP
ncbi:hypothetical protein O3M35_013312 [Rhynocoris fuscipes]|uniref:Secreted protein n=1 Tax=Rhynocoris fuscipes TaxID=488301 RepID=A0AAW1CJG8_9HEMI